MDDQIKMDLLVISKAMRRLYDHIRATHGGESDQCYAFLAAAETQEKLIDSVPGARDFILGTL